MTLFSVTNQRAGYKSTGVASQKVSETEFECGCLAMLVVVTCVLFSAVYILTVTVRIWSGYSTGCVHTYG